MAEREDQEYVAAVFSRRSDAETAVERLRAAGIADEHLGVAVREPGQQAFEVDVEHDELHAVDTGIVKGIPVGVLAGMGLVALTLPGIGTVAAGGLLAAGGAGGALIGGFLGGLVGLARASHELEESRAWEDYPLQPGEILVVARGHDQAARVTAILAHEGGAVVDVHKPRLGDRPAPA
jgi:hypothetical protein